MADTSTIQADFDRIALISGEGWNHNGHYHDFFLAHVPARCEQALDIGCGTGTFARLLAERADHVLGLDLSPQMIRLAWERSQQCPNIDFQVADVTTWAFPREHFDCIASIATCHHLSLEEMLIKARDALKVGGRLLILDLYEQKGLVDFFVSALAVPVHFALRLIKTGRLRQSTEAREAWAQHGLHEAYLPLSRIRQICARAARRSGAQAPVMALFNRLEEGGLISENRFARQFAQAAGFAQPRDQEEGDARGRRPAPRDQFFAGHLRTRPSCQPAHPRGYGRGVLCGGGYGRDPRGRRGSPT